MGALLQGSATEPLSKARSYPLAGVQSHGRCLQAPAPISRKHFLMTSLCGTRRAAGSMRTARSLTAQLAHILASSRGCGKQQHSRSTPASACVALGA